jgi:integrase
MSKKGQLTTSEPLPWNEAVSLIAKLKDEGDWKYHLLISAGIFFGLRISDIIRLQWKDILGKNTLIVNEQKTSKRRIITLNEDVQNIFTHAYLETNPVYDHIFYGHKDQPMTRQPINSKLKKLRDKYNLSIKNFSTHSLRKCFGRKLWYSYGKTYEALILLMDIFNHTDPKTTKRYLGITQDDISNAYKSIRLTETDNQIINIQM